MEEEGAAAAEAVCPPEEVAKADAEAEGDEAILARAQRLIAKIVETQANPDPRRLHALATILEAQESRYLKETASSPFNNVRASHSVGKIGDLIKENDEFYELMSSKFLMESVYSMSIHAAAARLLLSCSSSWMYHVFDDPVLDNIKSWVSEDSLFSSDEPVSKYQLAENRPTDAEMLMTYATGLLALSLTGSQVVEDMLTSGLSAKLMRYLRTRVFGDSCSGMAEANYASTSSSMRSTEETKGSSCQVARISQLGSSMIRDERLSGNTNADKHSVGNEGARQVLRDYPMGDGCDSFKSELTDSSSELVGLTEMIKEYPDLAGDGCPNRNLVDGKMKYGDSYIPSTLGLDEEADELPRNKVKEMIIEDTMQNGKAASQSSGVHLERSGRHSSERNLANHVSTKKVTDVKNNSTMLICDVFPDGEDNDERLRDCIIGKRDISDMVQRAIKAAEAEARAANAPPEAIKAAGDAAAELVKTTAIEVWKSTNNEEAAVLAASEAASTVVDAAKVTELSRNANEAGKDIVELQTQDDKGDDEIEELIILGAEQLAKLREKYCIRCLEILGEYVEALGPILHEKGVDVCLAFLQISIRDNETSELPGLLPEVLKLICALAAHRKFAALFVDRGGIQKLLSVRRVLHTFYGLSSCLFTIGSLQGIMERVCALPSNMVNQVVELALQLLECPQDQARKNAAIFFAAAFVFRAVLDSFDSQDGLKKMLNILHGAASIRSGGNPGTLSVPNGSGRNDRSPAEVLTSSEKQIAYHTCVALRQYFRAHLLLLVDSLRPNKSSRGIARSTSNARAAYRPLDISHEAMDSIFLQIQRDRKLGPAFVRARWPVVDKFLAFNGHITMLELCQAPPVERYLHDLAQYALGVLHIITFVKDSRKLIVNATLSNNRVGMAVILDAANGAGYVDPEVIHPALNVLVNLVCPPPSISNKPSGSAQGQQLVSVQTLHGPSDNRERHFERNNSDSAVIFTVQNESRSVEPILLDKSNATVLPGSSSSTSAPALSAGVVGDRRISLGSGAGCAGLAAQLEQGYRQAREAVRANNGIKVLLHLLNPRMITPPAALDCIRALACRVLLGLARDETIAHILTKLQVGKKLSELIRDLSSQGSGTEQARWQSELVQVSVELIAIVTNSGRASTLAATDAAAPTLRRIERAAIAAATPITYHSRELLLLIHAHLLASGLTATAALLKEEADLTPLPTLGAPTAPLHQTNVQEVSSMRVQWPSGRAPCGFFSDIIQTIPQEEDVGSKSCLSLTPKRKQLAFSSNFSKGKGLLLSHTASIVRASSATKPAAVCAGTETTASVFKSSAETEIPHRTTVSLPVKRKFLELKDSCSASPAKRLATMDLSSQSPIFQTPYSGRMNLLSMDAGGLSPTTNHTPVYPSRKLSSSNNSVYNPDDVQCQITPGMPTTPGAQFGPPVNLQLGNAERMTLDSLVVQYLKHQHRQCQAPITTLPPLSLLQPHVCPEPSHSLHAPANITTRVCSREYRKQYGGIYAHRRDRQFIYSRYRPCRTCRDDAAPLTCITFLGDTSRIATGSHSGELKIFDTNSGSLLESQTCHQTSVMMVQSAQSGGNQLVLSSALYDVKLWEASSLSGGPLHSFEGCKAARFSHSGTSFAALSSDTSRRDVLLYDVQNYNVELRLPDSSTSSGLVRGHTHSLIHFCPMDTMLLWNGTLWDRRSSNAIHRFDQFTDYGGGGFHPAGNEVIVNSEVWDLRKFKLLRTVTSLDQTVITFNGSGDVIYAILRRNLEEITSAINTRRVRHPLFPAFRTIDAVNYSDIATVQVDRCILDFATDPTDSYVGVIAMDDHEEMLSSAKLFEVGRKRATDDDSDPDDGGDTDEDEDENEESEGDMESIFESELAGGDSDSDDMTNEDDDADSLDDLNEDGDINDDDLDFNAAQGMLEIMAEGDEDDEEGDEALESLSSGDEADFVDDDFAS